MHATLLMASLLAVTSLLAFAASVSAFTEPGITGQWSDFANCPVKLINAPVSLCVHAYTTGGYVQIGHSSVPISIPGDTFDLGSAAEEGAPLTACSLFGGTECTVSPPHGIFNGPAQPVPGGLLGAIGTVQLTGVSAKLEWAAPVPPNTAFGTTGTCFTKSIVTLSICRIDHASAGDAATLSVKVHLLSPFLGSNCYIGTAASPIEIQLTSGLTSPPPPATPIHGKPYEAIHNRASGQLLVVEGVTLVGNSFAVPGATGCGTTNGSLINASINHKLGLPSAAGHNTIVITATTEAGAHELVAQHGVTGE